LFAHTHVLHIFVVTTFRCTAHVNDSLQFFAHSRVPCNSAQLPALNRSSNETTTDVDCGFLLPCNCCRRSMLWAARLRRWGCRRRRCMRTTTPRRPATTAACSATPTARTWPPTRRPPPAQVAVTLVLAAPHVPMCTSPAPPAPVEDRSRLDFGVDCAMLLLRL